MGARQVFCRGAIALCGKKTVLVLRLFETGSAVVVRLVCDKPPYHRSDIHLGAGAVLLRNHVARACSIASVPQARLRGISGCIVRAPEDTVLKVEAACKVEALRQREELFPQGVVRSTWRGPKLGSCWRKIGGAPS
ncbi:hypothetical protein [Acetobacter orientalis]|uniref:hypothetical protein n=1 Tax=Acetobacter orientalis TaxID=146474 RepID=UPI0039E845DB